MRGFVPGEWTGSLDFTTLRELPAEYVGGDLHRRLGDTLSGGKRMATGSMLRFAEEIALLLLDDEGGEFVRAHEWSMQCAFAGAVLMDLALEYRIDTDPQRLFVVDPTPLQDDLLDPTLALIARATETRDARYWAERIAGHAGEIRERALARLVERGILRRDAHRFLWVFRSRRGPTGGVGWMPLSAGSYPIADGKAERDVKLRIAGVLLGDEIPDPRDVVVICLADACGLIEELLSEEELERASARIEQVRRLDLIGQAVSKTVRGIESSLGAAAHPASRAS